MREEYVLAHTNNVDIVSNDKFSGAKHLKSLKFFKMITKRQMPDMFEDILYQDDLVRPLAPQEEEVLQVGDRTLLRAEVLFIHACEDLVEKALGHQESIVVYKQCIVAFEDSVSFEEVDPKVVFIDAKSQVKVKGPGIVYIETTREPKNSLIQSF